MSEQQETVETTAPAAEAPAVSSSKKNSSGRLWVVVIAVVILVGALLAYQQGYFGTMGDVNDEAKVMESDPSTVVASVNGVAITRGELDEKIAQIRQTIPDGVADQTQDASFEYNVLDELINLKVLVTRAEAQGISVTDEGVEAEIQTLVEVFGGEENFNAQLTVTGLTRDQLAVNMKNELLIRQLVDRETNLATVEVTDEEVKAAYDLAVQGGDAAQTPSLEEVSEVLKANLIQQKSSAIVEAYLSDLKAATDIQRSL